ncbi:MAG: hypothetical protein E7206_25910 [Clostridium beijerinckii]|nr:hypothetical protein [Clostridium beijerinckii]
MKLKKLILLGTIITTVTANVLPMTSYAAESTIKKSAVILNQAEEDKLDKYVELDATTMEYKIIDSANLSKDEATLLNSYIDKTNKLIKQTKENKKLSMKVENNVIHVTPRYNASGIHLESIDTDSYWDYDMHVWGMRVFLSRSFVDDMSSKVGNTTTYFAGTATSYALTQLLEELGMSSGPAGWIGLASGGAVVYSYDKIVSRCNSTGVYIDMNVAGGFAASGIYGA